MEEEIREGGEEGRGEREEEELLPCSELGFREESEEGEDEL